MTSSEQPVRGPVGMPAHLWELAKSDVRLSVPNRVRNAVANGLNAPENVRRIAARVAVTGAAMGVPAAMIGLGGFLDTADTPVGLAGGEAPLDGFDGAPAVPGSHDGGGYSGFAGGSGHGGGGGGSEGGGSEGFAHATTQGGGDVHSGLGSTWHVQDPSVPGGDWLTVQMFQDVSVTETADGMFVVDAWQFIVVHDSHGQEYVFKEHYQVVVPDPPGQETDLIIHERGFVHVTERPDGTFAVDPHFGIDVIVTADGDGKDSVLIGQSQHVRYTDTDGKQDDDVKVDLSEKATSTSDDEGDKATTTIDQGQVFDDGRSPAKPFEGGSKQKEGDADEHSGTKDGRDQKDGRDPKGGRETHEPDGGREQVGHGTSDGTDPSSPFGEEPADRGTAGGAQTGSPSAPTGTATSPTASSSTGPTASSGAATTARSLDAAPLASAAVAAPAASVLAGREPTGLESHTGPELDAPPSGQEQPAPQPTGTEQPSADHAPDASAPPEHPGTGTEPFAGSPATNGSAPFEPPATTGSTPGTTNGEPAATTDSSTPDEHQDPGDNTAAPDHESHSDTAVHDTPEPAQAEHAGNHDADHDTADHGTDGADHALAH
ncbi:hypothetical protein [Pseudonocardia endophytica]|uniref:Uncharacterized protein n=1 Tax=Pseudonocardia endophytica TaxID=401976 RepID=A0A4R1HXA4_PSEEN|nr:hypothetical protein [Pseudonocardia endophytica]TCK26111.1 hypothetical protein EV378_1940 [Pseudonocardia endophytica]